MTALPGETYAQARATVELLRRLRELVGWDDFEAERAEAEAEGLDPNRWFGEVEQVAARRIGRETVRYAR